MTIYIIIIAFSFFLEGILTNFLPFNYDALSIFTPLLALTSIVVLAESYYDEPKEYFIFALATGLGYDIFYTNTFTLNMVLFFLIALLSRFLFTIFHKNILNVIFIIIMSLTLYQILNYVVLLIIGYISFNIWNLFYFIINSYILNIVYGILLHVIFDRLRQKKNYAKLR